MLAETTLDISEARKQFNTLDQRLATEKVIFVTRHNNKAFAVVDVDWISAALETLEIMSDKDSYAMFMQSLEDIKKGKLHDHEDVKRELG